MFYILSVVFYTIFYYKNNNNDILCHHHLRREEPCSYGKPVVNDAHDKILEIYKFYNRLIYSMGLKYFNDRYYAEEVLQDTMLTILNPNVLSNISEITSERTKAYILSITRSRATDLYRRKTRTEQIQKKEEEYKAWECHEANSAEPKFLGMENAKSIILCISGLPERYRQIVIYRVFYELNFARIAKICNISEAAARKRMQRARNILAKRLIDNDILDKREALEYKYYDSESDR